jgi:flagellar basal body-associated protein FliL
MDKPRRSLGPAYIGLLLALITIVAVLSPIGGFVLVLLLAMMVYFMWGMHSRIRELEKAQTQPGQSDQ